MTRLTFEVTDPSNADTEPLSRAEDVALLSEASSRGFFNQTVFLNDFQKSVISSFN